MKILMLVPNLFVANGVASFVMNFLQDVDHERLQIDIASYKEGNSIYNQKVKEAGGNLYFLPSIKNLPVHIDACNKILMEGHYDIIHDNTLHVSIPMMWCAKQAGVPVRILHSHSSKMGETHVKEIRNTLFCPVLRSLATDYLACSQVAGQMMFGRQKFMVLPNVVCVEKYFFNSDMREKVRQEMNVQDKLVVGSVGRLAAQKNPFFAIDVFEHLLRKIPNAEYWWAGSGPLQEKVKTYIEEKGVSDCIRLLGSRNDVLELYQGMDAFFLPSLFEGLPVTGIEAQAMGLPMVVSDTVTDEMVYTGLVDYVNLNEKAEIWAEHLEMALRKKTDREQYAENLKRSKFSDVGCGKRLEQIYRQFMDA